jgi:hypothetical protein
METLQLLQTILTELAEIKKAILTPTVNTGVSEKWVRRADVMHFFSYAPTQMTALENSGDLIVSKIGKRKFILRESITKLLDNNIQSNQSGGVLHG